MKKLTVWTRYGELGASSRLRYYQFVPYLKKSGWEVQLNNFFADSYLHKLYAGNGKSLLELLFSWRRRCGQMRRVETGIPALIEYELLPFLPYFMEKRFLQNRRYILSFDDAVDLRYESIPVLCRKYPQLLGNAAGVITANDMLLDKFSKYNSRICKIPTVPPPLIPVTADKPERFTLLWIGTPVTLAYLYERRKALQMAAAKCDFELLIVGGSAIDGVPCRVMPWSEENENLALHIAHAGIMPLPETPFARGKSAYKLIRYLQSGIPAIASPVGENRVIMEEGRTGFFAQSDADWAEAICCLADPGVRAKMYPAIISAAGRYTLDSAAEKLHCFLTEALL